MYMQERELSEPETRREPVLVLVDCSMESERVVSSAWQLARALGGELITVITLPNAPLAEASEIPTLTEGQNAQVIMLNVDDNLLGNLSLLVDSENIGHVVMACPRQRWWPRLRPSLAEQLLEQHPNLNIHLVSPESRSE